MKSIKTALVGIKKQIKEVSLNEGVMVNTLFSCARMHQGKHHLYDDDVLKVAVDKNSPSRRGGAGTEEDYNFEEFD